MKREAVIDLYDEDYARTYNDRFLFGTLAKSDTDFEVALLEKLLADGGPWLDVACGTGYFLSRFPDIERAGLELSPAMLEHASLPAVIKPTGNPSCQTLNPVHLTQQQHPPVAQVRNRPRNRGNSSEKASGAKRLRCRDTINKL